MTRERRSRDREWEARLLRPEGGGTALAGLLLAAFVPVCWTLARGGADLHVSPEHALSWYAGRAAPIGAFGATALIWLRPASRSALPRLARMGAFAALGLAAWILYTGGGRVGPLSLGRPEPSAWVAVAMLLVAGGRGFRLVEARGRALGVSLVGILLGLGLGLGLVGLDRGLVRRALAAPSGVPSSVPSSPVAAVPRTDVVWIVVDTLRADAVGPFARHAAARAGEGAANVRAHTPRIDSVGERGVVFEHVVAPAPWTVPSMWGLLVSRWPSSVDPVGRGEAVSADRLPRLDPAFGSWVGRLRAAGYHTLGLQKNPFLGPGSGIEHDFDLYRMVGGDPAEGASGAQLVRAALAVADVVAEQREAGRSSAPFLLYLHFMDPHIDYRPPAAWRPAPPESDADPVDGTARDLHARLAAPGGLGAGERARLARLYAAEVEYLDARIGDLLDGLRARELLDPSTLVVLVSDHGEQFGEHGGYEHGDVHAENVLVPWIMAGAGIEPGRVGTPVSALDLGPTVLAHLGVDPLVEAEGSSRAARLGASDRLAKRDAAAATPLLTEYGEVRRWSEPPWVLIDRGKGRVELYDRERDPGERRDLAAQQPGRVAAMRARLDAHRARVDGIAEPPALRELEPRVRDALRELGYGR